MATRDIWSENPIVQRAVEQAEQAGEPTPLRVMEEMLGVMDELEDRFPGVPFADIIGDKADRSPGDLRKIRNALRRNGACEADIAIVCPEVRNSWIQARRVALSHDPYHDLAERL